MYAMQSHAMLHLCFLGPTLYSGKLARIWSCTAGFDVITYALVKKFFHCCAYPTFLETFIVFFLPDETP